MSITQIYSTEQFYKSVDPKEYQPGQICWVPVPNIEPIPKILDVERNTPTEHDNVKFEIRQANRKSDFRKRDRSLPIKYLNLRSNEELLVQRAKKRPSIIIASEVDNYPDITKILKQKAKKHQQQDSIFVIPCYSTQKDEYGSGIIPEISLRTQCFKYRQFFYLPEYKEIHESIARFDKIQVVSGRSPYTIDPTSLSLSEDLFDLFQALFIFCMSGEIINEDLDIVKELIRETLIEE